MGFLTFVEVEFMSTRAQRMGEMGYTYIVIRFLHYMLNAITFKVDCDKLKLYIVKLRATTKVLKKV